MEKVLINESTEPTPKVTALLWSKKYYETKIRKASERENSPEPLQSRFVPILPARARFPLITVGSVVEPSRIRSGGWK